MGVAVYEFMGRRVEAMVEQLPVAGSSRGNERRCNGGFGIQAQRIVLKGSVL